MWYVGFRHVYHIYSVLKISLSCTHTWTFQNAGHLPVISGGVTGPSGGRLETSTSRLVSRSLHWPSSSELKHKACPIALFQSLLSKICDQSHSLRTCRSSALRWFRFSYILQFLILFSIADSFHFYGSLRRPHWGSVGLPPRSWSFLFRRTFKTVPLCAHDWKQINQSSSVSPRGLLAWILKLGLKFRLLGLPVL